MKRQQLEDIIIAYHLGTLSVGERAAAETLFRKLSAEDRRLLDDYRLLSGAPGLEAEPQTPPPGLKDRIMSAIANEPQQPRSTYNVIRSEAGEWKQMFPGVRIKLLRADTVLRRKTVLMDMAPGSRLPRHRHLGVEEVYLLEGDGFSGGEYFQAGDYIYAEPESIHEAAYTEKGCLMLVFLPGIEVLET